MLGLGAGCSPWRQGWAKGCLAGRAGRGPSLPPPNCFTPPPPPPSKLLPSPRAGSSFLSHSQHHIGV